MKKYSFEDHPEHRKELAPHAQKWIANALSTQAQTPEEKETCRKAVVDLYAAANLKAAPVGFTRSPYGAACASAVLCTFYGHEMPIDQATVDLVVLKTELALDSTPKPLGKWYNFPPIIRTIAANFGNKKFQDFAVECGKRVWEMRAGGNQWSAWAAHITFFRYVAKLEIDYTKWDPWEKLSIHSGPRYTHSEFCIVSDRPEILTIDAQNRAHSDNGPFCRWRDGTALYSVHGIRIPAAVMEEPITVAQIDGESNAEVRRVMTERYGVSKYVLDSGAVEVDRSSFGILYRKDVPNDEPLYVVRVQDGTPEADGKRREFFLDVSGAKPTTAQEAVAATWEGIDPSEYAPAIET